MIKKVLEYFHIKCEINNKEVSLAGSVNILGKKRNIMQAYTVSQWFLFFFIYCFITLSYKFYQRNHKYLSIF